ncbi:MAG: DUF5106 domain-containing protein [Muribaculaceae bacterium]|nr:DUF5106 domain-containing protein [Muribaculaceae bacterium]
MTTLRKYILALSLGAAIFAGQPVFSQDIIQIAPLFEYPVAPESLTTLVDKSNYLIEHFWDPMDFKSTTAVDQNALNDAMKVYSVPMRWADLANAEVAIDKLIAKISKNPTLLTQFTKSAEEIIYGPRAEYWIDVVYIKFLDAFLKNKKVPDARKTKYEKQLTSLRNTLVGQKAPTFDFTGKNGKAEKYMPMSTPTIIIFGDPTQMDWRLKRMRLETNVSLRQAVEQGKLNILYIIPTRMDNWEKEVDNYPSKWIVGNAPDVDNIMDLRADPAVYYIGGDGNIVLKNTPIETAVNEALKNIHP